MSARRAADDAGFTLIEAMISLFVFSLIAAGSVLMLTQSVNTQARVAEAQAALRDVQTARAVLSADLAQYVGREIREANGRVRPRLIGGDADAPLAFVRAAAEPDGERGAITSLALVEYVFVDGSLIRRSRTRLDGAAIEETTESVVIADAGEARFEFYDGAAWRQQWLVGAQGSAPPRAVALIFASRRYGEVRIEAMVGLSG
ncbi:MAG: type II secretion system minor pseudopilin GspJ [Hyphomonadaceae bacterium]|nr:type II secretion system minor pseudopilin GspJ [Hyphomonadaceae bacterium]